MPVPEQVMVQHVVKVFPAGIVPGVHSASLWIQEHANTVDVIEGILEKLEIPAKADEFDLVEVYNESGDFPATPDLRDRARTMQEFESPVRVQREWQYRKGTGDKVGEYRIYLRQKTENLLAEKQPNVRLTWMDGLKNPGSPDEWHFDPFYRENEEIDDLVDLPVLNEEILLRNLQMRFRKGRIYTYVGGILIAINPFKYFPIYNPKYVLSYQHKKLGELPPHIFAIADIAYHRMLKDKMNQCIVISGESGSGKTESTKLVLHHLTALSHKTQATVLERTILAAGPVLEAFGNAKTCHNDNSSRFGKFTEITYRADGVVCGAVLRKYLLEKSRIVAQADCERNYHVFYYLLVGANPSEKLSLHLKEPQDYAYLNKSHCYSIESLDESYEFLRLQQAMRSIGFSGEVQQRLFSVLSAVLHIGNVKFVPKEKTEDAVDIEDNGVVDIVSKLLEVEKQTLINAFTVRRTVTRGEVFIRPYKEAEAVATRDGMAKALYGSVFDWIVFHINQTLKTRHNPRMSDVKAYSIGVLDIFGFEDFEMNSFEQFCINFANENLQYYLNLHIFKIRQDEYLSEGITWDRVNYIDNESCLTLINGRPLGLINLLDEECSLRVGTDESLLAKFNKHHFGNPFYEKPPKKESAFSVIHYAGTVKYQIKDFKTKNQDLMRNDIVASLKNSKMLFVRALLGSDPNAVYRWSILRNMICAISFFKQAGIAHRSGRKFLDSETGFSWTVTKSPTERKKISISSGNKNASKEQQEVLRKATKVLNRAEASKIRREQQRRKYNKLRKEMEAKRLSSYDTLDFSGSSSRGRSTKCPTVIGQFQNSLSELMDTLNKSHPFFVRCLRSNKNKAPLEFDAEVVLRQLQYTGMLETVKIRQAGYPSRILIQDFVKQYKHLLPHGDSTSNEEVPTCLKTLGLDPNHYQVGKNKVFMRESQYRILRDKLQDKLNNAARTIQRWLRAKLDRKRFLQTRNAAIVIQAAWRAYLVRKEVHALQRRLAARRIKEAWLTYRERKKLKSIRLIQSHWRGFLARKRFKDLEEQRQKMREENNYARKMAEAIVEDALSETIFSTEVKDRAGSLPTFKYVKDYRKHEYMEIPDPGDLAKNKALSTGYLENSSSYRIYEEIPALVSDVKEKSQDNKEIDYRASGVYDEIPSITKIRTGSAGSVDSSTSSGKRASLDQILSDTEKDRTPKRNIAKDLLRRRSFSRVKTEVSPKKSLESFTTEGYVLVSPASPRSREALDLTLPVNENKGSLLQIVRNLANRNKSYRRREEDKNKPSRVAESPMSTGGKEWKPTQNYVVQGDSDLKAFNEYLFKKISDMNKYEKGAQETVADRLFKKALQQYHSNLLNIYANVSSRNETIKLKYEEMSALFVQILEKEAEKTEQNLPTIMGANLFGSVVNEFVKHKSQSVKRRTVKQEKKAKKSKSEDFTAINGHKYVITNFNIATFCEFCDSFIWDRGFVCKGCKFTCHKKCSSKHAKPCKGKSFHGQPLSIFGAKLADITTDEQTIPPAIAGLMQEIEKNGLYTEGIYRKPGLQTAVKSLKNAISSLGKCSVDLSQYRIHVITSVLKLFFRQLNEPLVPGDSYDDFIRSADLQNESDIHAKLCDVIQRFPKPNRELLERLINHLAQVAMNEDSNKMSVNGLSIVWAPCVMRSGEGIDSMDALRQLPMQTRCLEVLIGQQEKKIRRTICDIQALKGAELELINKAIGQLEESQSEKNMIQKQIETLENERERITENLPNLERANSRGDLRTDSDDGITSDDGMTDNDDSVSSEKPAILLLQDPPFKGKRQSMNNQNKRGNGGSASSSYEDLSADLSDFNV